MTTIKKTLHFIRSRMLPDAGKDVTGLIAGKHSALGS
jgi:hypothetical protein